MLRSSPRLHAWANAAATVSMCKFRPTWTIGCSMIRLRAGLSRPILVILHIARRVTPISREHLGQQLHDGVDEVVPQISRFRHQAGGVRAVDYQSYLRRDAVGIANAQPGDDRCERGLSS